MKGTVLLTTFLLAAVLYDDGYRSMPIALVIVALFEGFIEPGWRSFKASRRAATKFRRERDNVKCEDIRKIPIDNELSRIVFLIKYGSDDSDEIDNGSK